jgi:uncharacterized protein (TIGR00106 family)
MMLCQFSISPLGAGESLGKDVARIIALIDSSGLRYQVHAMGTIVEGGWDEVMALIKQCHELMRHIHSRVSTTIQIDDRKDAGGRLTGKIDSIERHLGRKIST